MTHHVFTAKDKAVCPPREQTAWLNDGRFLECCWHRGRNRNRRFADTSGVCTNAVKRKRVSFNRVALRCELVDARGAGFDFKHPLAHIAQKVMMVMGMLALVVRGSARNFHHIYITLIHEDAQGAVDSSDSQTRRMGAGDLPDFGGDQRTTCVVERFLNG